VRELVRLFHRPEVNTGGAQLIFTTHDTSLLDAPGLFRRDQVWFVEKDQDQVSGLVALAEFSPRKNEALERGYLLGRYGGVPWMSRWGSSTDGARQLAQGASKKQLERKRRRASYDRILIVSEGSKTEPTTSRRFALRIACKRPTWKCSPASWAPSRSRWCSTREHCSKTVTTASRFSRVPLNGSMPYSTDDHRTISRLEAGRVP
jgi:hypothetical protein